MSKIIYWNLLVLLGVLCQEIIGITLSDKDIDALPELLIRQKRVINLTPGEDKREPIRTFPYIVTIKQFRGESFCVGVILTNHVVVTVAKCVVYALKTYRVYSGTSHRSFQAHPQIRDVTKKRTIVGHHPFRSADGIALISVNPSFIFSVNTHSIGLYEGHVEPGVYGTVAGWGCNPEGAHPGTAHPERLRAITVPIISNRDCSLLYHRTFAISDADICTLDRTGNQYCGVNDAGAPLVVNASGVIKLVGIHLWNGAVVGRSNPDVFARLQHPIYKTWITQTIPILHSHLNIPI